MGRIFWKTILVGWFHIARTKSCHRKILHQGRVSKW